MGNAARYDIFISYARLDNQPLPGESIGWVTRLKDEIEAHSGMVEGEPFSVFFDTSEITMFQDWEARLSSALRQSSVLLVCVGPNYFKSAACKWEWDEHYGRRVHLMSQVGLSEDEAGSVKPMYFVKPPRHGEVIEDFESWREQVTAVQGVDLQDWWEEGFAALSREKTAARMADLRGNLKNWVERGRTARATTGNVPRVHPHFVGRMDEVDALKRATRGPASLGVITAVHGVGGIGKTQLAFEYGHAYRREYPGGVWLVPAEGRSDLLTTLASLADDAHFNLHLSDDARGNPEQAGKEVLAELARRAAAGGVLVLLDNVSDPHLLSDKQTQVLPQVETFDVVATTRLGAKEFAGPALTFVELGPLPDRDALALLRAYQPIREGVGVPDFADREQRAAAERIVSILDGFTLAVEQVAVFMGNPLRPVSPVETEKLLAERGLTVTDAAAGRRGGDVEIRHQQGLVKAVLDTTLATLPPVLRTALEAASLLPPDVVPWPWLEAVTKELHPEIVHDDLLSDVPPWDEVAALLQSRRLVTGDHNGDPIGRVHRVISAYAKPDADSEVSRVLRVHLLGRVVAMHPTQEPSAWELSALLDHAMMAAESDPDWPVRILQANPDFLTTAGIWLTPSRCVDLARKTLERTRAAATADETNSRTWRSVSSSLLIMARLIAPSDPNEALGLYRESLEIRRGLVEVQPGNLEARRDVSVSLNNVASIVRSRDADEALELYQVSLEIRRGLAEAQPGHLQAADDLARALMLVAMLSEDSSDHSLFPEAVAVAEDALRRGREPHRAQLLVAILEEGAASTAMDASTRQRYAARAAELRAEFGITD